ncbi:efflux RND transporter periplasmic adaptor subunit [Motilimonas cestriensis]|uniref:Efflux RND transporter periplasmic adaptor subunit n=1 Tax=Motilimonas cestriensis TaxID=2742685 RepID=A0ABS8WDS1_9GAMM|nr:efflux RND transporter periplasmic adaptor subunit [Motilimonas cestriensis]MCE2596415.1 efflux RND transporter periplasmic adaptor subunit [Motilimonas cestriensis]
MTKTKWSMLLLAGGLATALYYGWIGASEAVKPSAKAVRKVEVVTDEVQAYGVAQHLNLVGSLAAQQSVDLAFQIFAPVAKILVNANAEVVPNQVLVQLDDSKARAAFVEAQSVLTEEQRKLKEFQRIVSRGAITQTELDAQRASVDVASARLAAAQAALDDHQLRAPFAGTLGLIDVNLGDMKAVGEAVMNLDNLNVMQLDLSVPERYLSQISRGMSITAKARAWPDHDFVGQVVAIDSRVNQNTLNVRVRVNFENPDQRLKPGMFMSATMTFPEQTAPVVPVQALEYSGTKRFVYVLQADGTVARTEVVLGARVKNEVLIESGLAVGDRIVVQGLVNMRDGIKVQDLQTPVQEPS